MHVVGPVMRCALFGGGPVYCFPPGFFICRKTQREALGIINGKFRPQVGILSCHGKGGGYIAAVVRLTTQHQCISGPAVKFITGIGDRLQLHLGFRLVAAVPILHGGAVTPWRRFQHQVIKGRRIQLEMGMQGHILVWHGEKMGHRTGHLLTCVILPFRKQITRPGRGLNNDFLIH